MIGTAPIGSTLGYDTDLTFEAFVTLMLAWPLAIVTLSVAAVTTAARTERGSRWGLLFVGWVNLLPALLYLVVAAQGDLRDGVDTATVLVAAVLHVALFAYVLRQARRRRTRRSS